MPALGGSEPNRGVLAREIIEAFSLDASPDPAPVTNRGIRDIRDISSIAVLTSRLSPPDF
jgi:hypothetical protein